MKRLTPSLLTLVLLAIALSSYEAAPDRREMVVLVQFSPTGMGSGSVGYNKAQPLTYKDFQGQPENPNSMTAAMTHTEMGFKMRTRTSDLRTEALITIYAGMYPKFSWMRPSSRTPEVLRHEQLHFDISALWACRMKHAMEATRFSMEQFRNQLESINDAYQDSCWAEQLRYDRETGHSTNREGQARWEADIAARLAAQGCF